MQEVLDRLNRKFVAQPRRFYDTQAALSHRLPIGNPHPFSPNRNEGGKEVRHVEEIALAVCDSNGSTDGRAGHSSGRAGPTRGRHPSANRVSPPSPPPSLPMGALAPSLLVKKSNRWQYPDCQGRNRKSDCGPGQFFDVIIGVKIIKAAPLIRPVPPSATRAQFQRCFLLESETILISELYACRSAAGRPSDTKSRWRLGE